MGAPSDGKTLRAATAPPRHTPEHRPPLARARMRPDAAGVRACLLDPWWREVPDGVDGEPYLAGPQITDGCVGRPGLTAARFVPDVFAGDGPVMYRTTEPMRRVDGRPVLRMRADTRVKARGYRIELGEAEAAIATAVGVDVAAACVTGDGTRPNPGARKRNPADRTGSGASLPWGRGTSRAMARCRPGGHDEVLRS